MTNSSSARVAGLLARRRARPAADRAGLLVAAIAVALLTSSCSSGSAPGWQTQDAASPTTATSPTQPQENVVAQTASTGSSLVATAHVAHIKIWTGPGTGSSQTMTNPTVIGGPLTFLVLESRTDWLRVQLPKRPNGSSGWVSESDVVLSTTPYRLAISMSKHRLDVMYKGKRIERDPVGVGKVATPTPKGTYYLTELIQPPNPAGAYGPYAFGLSAYSNTLKTFAGGPGQLGLHGTDAPKGLGHSVSHGCLRVANSVITRLAKKIPLGTPLEIRS